MSVLPTASVLPSGENAIVTEESGRANSAVVESSSRFQSQTFLSDPAAATGLPRGPTATEYTGFVNGEGGVRATSAHPRDRGR